MIYLIKILCQRNFINSLGVGSYTEISVICWQTIIMVVYVELQVICINYQHLA